MAYIDFIQPVHQATKRDYLSRVLSGNKAEFATIAKKFDVEYRDGSRHTGYGGYSYHGRWKPVAERIASHYKLKAGSRVLDVGCGKGFLLKDLLGIVAGLEVAGIDISEYAVSRANPEVKIFLRVADATRLDFPSDPFHLVRSINTLLNLKLPYLESALKEIESVGRGGKYIVMDGYRTEQEKVNILYWQLISLCFSRPVTWEWIFKKTGYTRDYSLVYLE